MVISKHVESLGVTISDDIEKVKNPLSILGKHFSNCNSQNTSSEKLQKLL